MRVPNPTKLIPRPHQVIDLGKRVVDLVPGLPGKGTAAETEFSAPPSPPPAPVAKPKPPKPKPAKPKAAKPKPPKPKAKAAKAKPAKAKPKPKVDPPEPHHALNNPVGEPDPTAWPDPYDRNGDERDPHPAEDPDTQAAAEKLKREKLDD